MDQIDIEDIGAFLNVEDSDSNSRMKQFNNVQIQKKKALEKNANNQNMKVYLNPEEIKDEHKKYIESLKNFEVPGTQKIYFKTFGCAHNISDSEFMMGLLTEYGYKLVEKLEDCDLIFLNSCTVKNPSEQAFISLVEIGKKLKKHIVVAGCVPQGDKNIPEIQGISVVGTTQIDRCVEVVSETLKGNTVQLLGKKSLPSLDLPKIRKNHLIEIVPINSGCLGACTYCKTVHARGKLGSYPIQLIVNRIKQVAKQGVKDVWLSSEDTGAYGRDINTNIAVLLKEIVQELPKEIMIRVGMTNPPFIKAHMESIAQILKHPQVYSFIHIPVQAGNNQVLEKMNREYLKEDFEELCDYLLANVPNLTIATDIICGFPGETEEQFKETLQLVDKYKLAIVNISQFYPRPGTLAAKMPKVNSKDVKDRSRLITKLIDSYTDCYSHYVGTEQLVWIRETEESKKFGNQLIGHTKAYVKVLLPFDNELMGKCIKMKITKSFRWHIEGEIIDKDPPLVQVPVDYFQNYKEEGFTKREEKYQQIIKDRLNEAENNENKMKFSDIYENFKNKQSNIQIQQQQNGVLKENGEQKQKKKQCNGDCEKSGGNCKDSEKDEEEQDECCGDNCEDECNNHDKQQLNLKQNLQVQQNTQSQPDQKVEIEKDQVEQNIQQKNKVLEHEIQQEKQKEENVGELKNEQVDISLQTQEAVINLKKSSDQDKLSSDKKMLILGIVLIGFGILVQCMISQFKK